VADQRRSWVNVPAVETSVCRFGSERIAGFHEVGCTEEFPRVGKSVEMLMNQDLELDR
jgi:hypothetical protein